MIKVLQDIHSTKLTSALVRKIYMILQIIEQWKIKYISRKRNQVADRLIKMTSERNSALQVFEKTPEELVVVVEITKVKNFRLYYIKIV